MKEVSTLYTQMHKMDLMHLVYMAPSILLQPREKTETFKGNKQRALITKHENKSEFNSHYSKGENRNIKGQTNKELQQQHTKTNQSTTHIIEDHYFVSNVITY